MGDDQFNCTAGQCTPSSGNAFDCCSATKTTNSSGSDVVYTVHVASTRAVCAATDKSGPYTIVVTGLNGFG